MNKRQKEMQWLYLNNEERAIKELEKVYKQAQKDIEKNIESLLARSDADTATVIYQVEHQKSLRKQISGAIDVLEANQFTTVSDYLVKCYETGFIGAQYDMHGQGVPLIFPIDQKKMANAVRIDSAISEDLYARMGENVKGLKKQITSNISRGIATGLGYAQIAQSLAQGMNSPYNKAINRTKVIVRTEGHRIQIQSQLDACQKAKEAGADILKQWDSTMDGRTRSDHRELDGQIRELNEDFEYSGGTVKAPGFFGTPAQDCNCRCALLQRPRWALDKGELEILKERAEYFGLNKNKDFEDFRQRFLEVEDIIPNLEKYRPLESKAKASQFAKQHLGVKSINTKELSKDVLNKMNEALYNIYNDYPELKGIIQKVGYTDEAIAAFVLHNNKGMISTSLLLDPKDIANIDDIIKKAVGDGRWSPKDGVEGIIRHEMAHALEAKMAYDGVDMFAADINNKLLRFQCGRAHANGFFAESVVREAFDNLGIEVTEANIKKNVSEYASEHFQQTKKLNETFAEIISDNRKGDIYQEVIKIIKER